ncbi:unnamed protein product [Lymnaea stagnalis]|uniref:Uncharacterized protein n=1 Tax=Lymnaea stagnalis TaxID=6523 RepID=A0AAV2I442_LYMST
MSASAVSRTASSGLHIPICNFTSYLRYKCCIKYLFGTSLLRRTITSSNFKKDLLNLQSSNLKNFRQSKHIPGLYFRQDHTRCSSTLSHDESSPSPVFLKAEKYLENTAVVDRDGSFTYADLLHHSMCLAVQILETYRNGDMKLDGDRIALLTEYNATYIICQFATWICNGISVPLCNTHPASEWEYFLQDSQCSLILVSSSLVDKISPVAEKLGIRLIVLARNSFSNGYPKNRWFQPDHASNPKKMRRVYEQRKQRWFDRQEESVLKKPSLIVYTSGTTGPPKGVVLTHGNLAAMAAGMIKSWEWTQRDVVLHVLPLHHLHGIVNVLLTPLSCGATVVMEPKFDAKQVWHLLTTPSIEHFDRSINLFMAVPTIYAKLIDYYERNITEPKAKIAADFIHQTLTTKIRLMVSGSSALPQPISERWTELSGHELLERYGMTEIGMALSNPLYGPRVPGAVGTPMPDVEVRIVKPNVYNSQGYDILVDGNSRHSLVTRGSEEEIGDLLVRGPSVAKEYWKKPEATKEAFTKDGWFKTGDTARYKKGVYFIVGRTSVDVIKSGGYKISALDVERHLLAHPDIADCAVVGLSDMTWGQKVAAILVLKSGGTMMDLANLREWASSRLPPYQLPTVIKCLDSLPRNTMGKVNKKELVNHVFPEFAHKKW